MRLLVVLCKELIGFFHMNCIWLNLYFEWKCGEEKNALAELEEINKKIKKMEEWALDK